MRLVAGISLLCVASAASAQAKLDAAERAALAGLDACIPRLDAALDVGYERIAARCPDLAPALERSGWAQWLPSGWKEPRNDLSAGSLVELRALVSRETNAADRGAPHPSVERLDAVLKSLGPAAQQRSSLWARFRAWLRAVVERNRAVESRSWLDRMIQRDGRSQTFMELLTYGSLALIVVLAGVIVANELRAAGLLRSRSRPTGADAIREPVLRKRLNWADVEQAQAVDKPRVLLELVIARLTDMKRLPPAGALTVRELTQSVVLEDADRDRLAAVARTAERARYSATPLATESVGEAVEQGRELLDRLGKPA